MQNSCSILFFVVVMIFAGVGCSENTTGSGADNSDNGNSSDQPTEEQRSAEADSLDPNIPDDYSDIAGIENFEQWGPYNVHDPTLIKEGEWYYMYSTDVYYGGCQGSPLCDARIPIRKSKNLVDWQPIGHVFDQMPSEVVEWIREIQPDYQPVSVWAPFIYKVGNQFRLYYSVPANDMKTAYLGLATSSSPEGPWTNRGLVLPTYRSSPYNGIDPAVTVDRDTGEHWLIYGSWSDGIHAVELNPETGFRKNEKDIGHIIARRPKWGDAVPLEGAEVIYRPENDKYYLFVSYDPLIETYNVRVGRADSPEGPYSDMHGRDMADLTNNYPRITAQYRFNNHPGWQGIGHTGLLRDGENYYLASQGRLGSTEPSIHLMVLHLRKMVWTEEGWPVLSPERYAGVPQVELSPKDLEGRWEYISLDRTEVKNRSSNVTLLPGGSIDQYPDGSWSFDSSENKVSIQLSVNYQFEAQVMRGWDWENDDLALLFTGLDSEGVSQWGKRVDDLEAE